MFWYCFLLWVSIIEADTFTLLLLGVERCQTGRMFRHVLCRYKTPAWCKANTAFGQQTKTTNLTAISIFVGWDCVHTANEHHAYVSACLSMLARSQWMLFILFFLIMISGAFLSFHSGVTYTGTHAIQGLPNLWYCCRHEGGQMLSGSIQWIKKTKTFH